MKSRFIARSSSLAIIAAAMANGAVAQTDGSEEAALDAEAGDVIVVKGIRQSLSTSAAIKRNSSGVVDAITADDIGSFPDTNLAESLQRITGVSINRVNNEGSRVTVRGFGPNFNIVTLNGRQMPGSSIGNTSSPTTRSFDFSNLAAEGVAGVEVYKTGRADVPTGGIGSTINIKTAKPFDLEEFTFAYSAKGLVDTSNETGSDITPELSGIISKRFADDRIGVLVNGSFQRRDSREQNAQIDGWLSNVDLGQGFGAVVTDNNTNPFGNVWSPRNSRFDQYDHERKRLNLQGVLQFQPTDRLRATVDYTYSKFEDDINGNTFGVWFNTGANVNEAIIDENGTVIFLDEADGTYDFFGFKNLVEQKNDSFGANVEYDVTDSITLEADVHFSDAKVEGTGVGNNSFIITSIQLTPTGGKVYDNRNNLDIADITVNPGPGFPVAASSIDSLLGISNSSFQENQIDQYQLKLHWDNEQDGALRKLLLGGAYTEMEHKSTFANNFFGYGFAGGNAGAFDDSLFTAIDTSGQFDAFDRGNLPPTAFTFNTLDVIDVAQSFFGLGDFLPGDLDSDDRIKEETWSAYILSSWETEFNNMPVRANAGVRYEHTDVTGTSLQLIPVDIRWQDPTEFFTVFSPDTDFNVVQGEGYDVFLPNFDIDIQPTDSIVARFSYSRTMTRPNLNNLRAATSVTPQPKIDARSASSGNPNLRPFLSDNIDFSLEYYYGEGNYISVGYYKKFVENFLVSTLEETPLFGLRDPASGPRVDAAIATIVGNGGTPTQQAIHAQLVSDGFFITPSTGPGIYSAPDDDLVIWDVTTVVNGENVEVGGWEFAMQHALWDTGFGVQANYTIVNGDVDFDREIIDTQFVLPGLSDSFNLVGYYDKNGIQARIAYNWRDSFLSALGQQEGGALEPQFTEEFGQLDVSASYDIADNITVFFEGINVLNETQRIHGRYQNQLLNARQFGPRYAFGVRGSF